MTFEKFLFNTSHCSTVQGLLEILWDSFNCWRDSFGFFLKLSLSRRVRVTGSFASARESLACLKNPPNSRESLRTPKNLRDFRGFPRIPQDSNRFWRGGGGKKGKDFFRIPKNPLKIPGTRGGNSQISKNPGGVPRILKNLWRALSNHQRILKNPQGVPRTNWWIN